MKKKDKLFLVCTGLGRVYRGFEIYIQSLAKHLQTEGDTSFEITVFAGGKLSDTSFETSTVFNINRNQPLLKRVFSSDRLFAMEQFTFFLFFLPHVFLRKPRVIYLGEYKLFCYLFKARKFFGLNFSLVLYTGGQVSPGLFDSSRDYVHHVTDIYYQELIDKGIPVERQFVIPHFINTDFKVNNGLKQELRGRALGKKIVLSVGTVDRTIKRMHLIANVFGDHAASVFPILLGEQTRESEEVRQLMINKFGISGFFIGKVPREELGSYYSVADMFVLCSEKESFGLVFLEAMYFNTPVICHDFHESRYVLKEYGHFINMNSVENFKERVNELIPTITKQPELSNYVQQNYTWAALRDKYLSMFNTVIR